MDREKELVTEIYLARQLHKKKALKRNILSLTVFGLFLLVLLYFSGNYYFYTFKDILYNTSVVFEMVLIFFFLDRIVFHFARKRDAVELAYITMLEVELEYYRSDK